MEPLMRARIILTGALCAVAVAAFAAGWVAHGEYPRKLTPNPRYETTNPIVGRLKSP